MQQIWNDVFHAPVDLTSLAVFRMLAGCLMLLDGLSYARHAPLLLDPGSPLSHLAWRNGPHARLFSLLRWLPATPASVRALCGVYALAGAALAVGLVTPIAAATAFLCLISLHNRNRHAVNAGDALLRILCLFLVFADAGRVLSVDQALSAAPRDAVGSPWILRLMQIQICALYLFSVRFKLEGASWRRLTATHYATRLLAHRRRRLPKALDGRGVHALATACVLAVESLGPIGLWFAPTRLASLVGLALLHVSLLFWMRMHLFQWILLAALVLFLPGEDLARLIGSP